MTPKQKKDFADLDAVVKTLIGKVFELEDENREINAKLDRVLNLPAPPLSPLASVIGAGLQFPLPPEGEKGNPDAKP